MNVFKEIEKARNRKFTKKEKRLQAKADKAMAKCEKKHPHNYDVYENCKPCAVWMTIVREDCEELRWSCRQDPIGIHWQALASHVHRAKTQEMFMVEGCTSGCSSPAELIETYSKSQIEWVYALMYMLGWKRPDWAKDWEWM